MKYWVWIILLLPGAAQCAQRRKLEGYVMDRSAFRNIQSYCVDTHNLPPDQIRVIDHFVRRESKPQGLLSKLPWHRRATCQDASLEAVVRMEFPRDQASSVEDEVEGVLLVFRPGSPSPIYETPAVSLPGEPRRNPAEDDEFAVKLVSGVLEYSVLSSVVRILIHDWQKQ